MTLTLTNIAKTFPGGVKALLPTDLEIAKGEIVSLLGPSGCGKSTLLRLIAGLEQPQAGRILIDGRDVTALPPPSATCRWCFNPMRCFRI